MIGVWPTALGLASVRVGASRNSWARARTMLLVGARAAELLPLPRLAVVARYGGSGAVVLAGLKVNRARQLRNCSAAAAGSERRRGAYVLHTRYLSPYARPSYVKKQFFLNRGDKEGGGAGPLHGQRLCGGDTLCPWRGPEPL